MTLASAAASLGTGVVPYSLDRATVWTVTLGAVGNFIWAVESRMMRVSFGRPALARAQVWAPALAFNLGTAIALGASLVPTRGGLLQVRTAGLGFAGAGMIWLAVTCGVVHGRPTRLRVASQPLARFIIWANRWAVISGIILLLLSARTVLPSPVAGLDLEDAALHAIEVGLVTMLIAGMLQLVAPIFAMQRMDRGSREQYVLVVWALLMTATISRIAASLLPVWFAPLAGVSGVSGWLGLASLMWALARGRR